MPQRRRRPALGLLVAAVSGGLAGWVFALGCQFPEYTTELGYDSSTDGDSAPVDSGISDDTNPYVMPDGRVCIGHDEDGDGVPDECDNCPNVANADQSGGEIGDVCKASTTFIPAPVRLLFDPFTSLGSWHPYGTGSLFELDADRDSLVGGTKADDDFRFMVGTSGAGTSALVVTSVLTLRDEGSLGSAGLIVRVTGDKRFYICAISTANGFAAARAPDTGCTGGPCGGVLTFAVPNPDGGSPVAAQYPFPSDLPHAIGDPIGLRVSITGGGGDAGTGGDIECRVFDPKRPSTLSSGDPKYSAKIPIGPSKWLASGEVGAYARSAQVQIHSMDVLRGP